MPATPVSPLFDWLDHRAAGVLLHPTSFPGDFGVGTLGSEARQFVDFLSGANIRYWQVCPLGPTGYGDSPYQCVSAFAGNPYLIDLLELCNAGLVRSDTLGPLLFLSRDRVDFGSLYKLKWPILRKAFEGFKRNGATKLPYGDFDTFKTENALWLDPFAWYQALKQHYKGQPWYEWPEECRTLERFREAGNRSAELEDEAEAQRFYQYLFFGQWKSLRRYARKRSVRIIGDIPIFVSYDSADVWSAPHLFQIDQKTLQPTAVAGVPPDYFSADGQYWGNPLFDWKHHEKTGYEWWLERLKANFELYDVVRIDHFRGFEAYWRIPFGSPTAKHGKWVKGPGLSFFRAVAEAFPSARIIAEDLGTLTPEVFDLLAQTGLPGMAVLQFAFGGDAENLYLPHNLNKNSVIYPGTHDNDTTLGWYRSSDPSLQDHVRRYLRISGEEIAWDFLRTAYRSSSRLAILPLQDMMNLDSRARFNTPGQQQGNWQWRYQPEQLETLRTQSSDYLCELATLYGRDPDLDPPAQPTAASPA
jgi:4-alpha-glucanotransferase